MLDCSGKIFNAEVMSICPERPSGLMVHGLLRKALTLIVIGCNKFDRSIVLCCSMMVLSELFKSNAVQEQGRFVPRDIRCKMNELNYSNLE